MLTVDYPIIVEGKYDKIKLSSLIDGLIIPTDGFGLFRDKQRLDLIRQLGEKGKIIILTDSDRAGFKIRGCISGVVAPENIIHIYIPQLQGREKRKTKPSAEGTLGVEGMSAELLRRIFIEAGVVSGGDDGFVAPKSAPITKLQLYELGLYGGTESAKLRRKLLRALSLPQGLSASAMPEVLSRFIDIDSLKETVDKLRVQL